MGVDARGTAGEVSTAVTGGRFVSDISRSSSWKRAKRKTRWWTRC